MSVVRGGSKKVVIDMLNLVSDILDLSKIEAGAMQLKLESLDLAEVINDAVRSVRPILEDNKHRLHITVDKGLPRVSADEQRLRQVLLNLLSNAIKFTPPGGELAIGVSENDGGWTQRRGIEPFTAQELSHSLKSGSLLGNQQLPEERNASNGHGLRYSPQGARGAL